MGSSPNVNVAYFAVISANFAADAKVFSVVIIPTFCSVRTHSLSPNASITFFVYWGAVVCVTFSTASLTGRKNDPPCV